MRNKELPGQENMFGEEPSGEPTELTFKKKAEFGTMSLKFKVEAGLDLGHAAAEIENLMGEIIMDLEKLDERLKNHEIYTRTERKIQEGD